MRRQYIYQLKDWPHFEWNQAKLALLLAAVHQHQGRLLGHLETLGLHLRDEAMLKTLTLEVVKSSEIENEILDANQVRSSIARRLGMDIAGLIPADRQIDGVVEMTLDALQHYDQPLTKKRLLDWHASLFPTGESGMHRIVIAAWRNDLQGPMQVISGPIGRERVHFEAPPAKQIENEIKIFLKWFNEKQAIDPVIKAGIAHFWFVTIHPFEDGNGRVARVLTDLQLARAENSAQRFYSMSAQIRRERNRYYEMLEKAQKGNLDITDWLEWFLTCLDHALTSTVDTLDDVLHKARFWNNHKMDAFNERQRIILNKLFEGFVGNLTSSKWAKITKCSQDTALRDIQDLIDKDILRKDTAGGRSTRYLLQYDPSINHD